MVADHVEIEREVRVVDNAVTVEIRNTGAVRIQIAQVDFTVSVTVICLVSVAIPIIMGSRTQSQEDISMKLHYIALAFTLTSASAIAGNSTWDAAIGGGIGGAAGAAIGNEVGGRDGAIIGGALGGAVGVAVNTDEKQQHGSSYRKTSYRSEHHRHDHHHSHFCPPGQAKKGRC